MKHRTGSFIYTGAILFVGVATLISCNPARTISPTSAPPENTPIASLTATTTQPPPATSTNTAVPTKTSTPTDIPYVYEGRSPGVGSAMLKDIAEWRNMQMQSGAPVDEAENASIMYSEYEAPSIKAFWRAIQEQKEAPDLTGLPYGVAFICNYPMKYIYKITPEIAAEFEEMNVAVILHYGPTYLVSNPTLPKIKDVVQISDDPTGLVDTIMIGGDDEKVRSNFEQMGWGYRVFTLKGAPQEIVVDNGDIFWIAIIPLDKESIKDFNKRNGLSLIAPQKGPGVFGKTLYLDQTPILMRGSESMKDFMGMP